MRVLLVANMVYAFVLPVLNVFVAAYVLRKSDDVTLVSLLPKSWPLARRKWLE
jgi:YQGE family putative transporter